MSQVYIHKPLGKWDENAQWCTLFGKSQTFAGTFLPMVNNCLSGPASLRTHLFENWLYPGSLVLWLMCSQFEFLREFDFLCDTILSHSSLDILTFARVPLAGYHDVRRNGSDSDLKQKIVKPQAFLYIFPMLISNFDDRVYNNWDEFTAEQSREQGEEDADDFRLKEPY